MAYDTALADKVRTYLSRCTELKVEEKKMFRGLGFMVNGKMCVNVSGQNLMCRFDPLLQEEVAAKKGFEHMIMKGKEMKGYCYIQPAGFSSEDDFQYWMHLCLDYNERAKASKRKK